MFRIPHERSLMIACTIRPTIQALMTRLRDAIISEKGLLRFFMMASNFMYRRFANQLAMEPSSFV